MTEMYLSDGVMLQILKVIQALFLNLQKKILVERLFLSCVLKLPLNKEVKELHQLLSKEYVAMQRKRDTLQLKDMPNFPNKEMILISKVPSNFTKKPVLLKLQEKTDKLL